MPFPHCSNWQLASQPSPLTLFASSHCSPSIRQKRPSPQKSTRHPVQPSHGVVFPSSHSSPGSPTPFPQNGGSVVVVVDTVVVVLVELVVVELTEVDELVELEEDEDEGEVVL